MAVLDFPSSPTVGQTATLTNGFTYQWDGAVWTLAASTGQAAGGDLSGSYPNPVVAKASNGLIVAPTTGHNGVTFGNRTIKGRVFNNANTDLQRITINADLNAAENAWIRDDPTKGAWIQTADAGAGWSITRIKADGSFPAAIDLAEPGLATVTRTGAGDQVNLVNTISTRKGHLGITPTPSVYLRWGCNDGTTMDDTAKSAWSAQFDDDAFTMWRSPPGATAAWANLLSMNAAGKLTCSLANSSVTLPMLGARSTLANLAAGSVPVNFSCGAGVWTRLATCSAFTARGSLTLLWLSCGLFYGGAAGADVYVNLQSTQGGGWMVRALAGAGATVWVPFGSLMAVFWLSPGAVTFYADVYTSAGSLATRADGSGYLHALEFA
jgi:hypothetical protein